MLSPEVGVVSDVPVELLVAEVLVELVLDSELKELADVSDSVLLLLVELV